MPSISGIIDLLGKLESPLVTVHQDRCIMVRNRNANCLRCAEACTSGCISFDGENLTISPERCIGCGTCATVCPTCCLEARNPNDAQLLNECLAGAQRTEGTAIIACGEFLDRARGLFDPDKVARVECLGRVEESLLSEILAQGIEDIVLVHGACATCEHATGRAAVEDVLETQQCLLEAWGVTGMSVRLASKLPGKARAQEVSYDTERRDAFRQGGESLRHIGAVAASTALGDTNTDESESDAKKQRYAKVMDDGTLPHFIPDRRERLLDALASLGEARDVEVNTRLWGHVSIDIDLCESCRMCAVFCPTGALRKFDADDGTFGVEHYPGDCVKCRCCESICPANAITISDEVLASDVLKGTTEIYEMKEPAVKKGAPHAIWHTAKLFTNTTQVYER